MQARALAREQKKVEARKKIEAAKRARAEAALQRTKHPLYGIWTGMRHRCSSTHASTYPNYAGRDIRVCPEWDRSFSAFRNYCEEHLGPRPEDHSIDRIDNNGDYEPGNVRWATASEQARNTRANVELTIGGETKLLVEWAEEHGLDANGVARLRSRIRAGVAPLIALTAAVLPGGGRPRGSGVLTAKQLDMIEERGLSMHRIRDRVSRGWSVEEAVELPVGAVRKKLVTCSYCGSIGHTAASHPEYRELMEQKYGKPYSKREAAKKSQEP